MFIDEVLEKAVLDGDIPGAVMVATNTYGKT
jgi:hypothetical protein